MADTINPVDDVMLAEDGHQIGQLALADTTAVVSVDDAAETAEAELSRSKEEELGADLALYPGYEDMDLRQRAKTMFVVEARRAAEIAGALGVPERTVSMWVYNERWDALVRKEIAVRDMQSKLELSRMRAEKRNEVAAEHLQQARAIRQEAMETVRNGHVKSGTEAWAAAARVEQTILGIKEGGEIASTEGEDGCKAGEKDGRKPLVVVFNNGLPAASRR